jgi:DNA-directed RNA polymerase I, II, and III subunit RPABC3
MQQQWEHRALHCRSSCEASRSFTGSGNGSSAVELLPVEREYKFSIELASTLNLDGTPDSGVYEKRDARSGETRLSGCDYAMHGKVFKYEQLDPSKVYASNCSFQHGPRAPAQTRLVRRRAVYMSFGGLLMKLEGDPRDLEGAEMDTRLYILMKRITY